MKQHVFNARFYYQDTDAGGVVHHAKYIDFFERARTEWLNSLGFDVAQLAEKNIIFAVASLTVDYLKPARLNQCIDIVSRVLSVGKASLHFSQHVCAVDQHDDVFCRGKLKLVCTDLQFRPQALPQMLKEVLI